jgi:hypothetical protein
MIELARSLLKKFVNPCVIKKANNVTDKSVWSLRNQLPDEDLFVGYLARQKISIRE